MFVSFSDLPGQQNLFLDYLYEFENVKNFYHFDFRDEGRYPALFASLSKKERAHREKLPEIIRRQYAGQLPSKQTLDNIEALSKRKTIAVVTGQQLGLFCGPLYTFYKIATAIKLCSYLRDKYDDYSFVPVFWLEGDDHDFEEVRSVNIIDDSNEVKQIIYDDGEPEEINRGSVGKLEFHDGIIKVLNELDSTLRENDFKLPLMQKLSAAYSEGATFKSAFRKLLFSFFDEYGLVMFDPQDEQIKNILKPLFKKEIEEFRLHTDGIVRVSAELEEVYHAQVKVNPVNLFYSDHDGRYLIEPADGEFRLKGKRKRLTKEHLQTLIEQEPEKFSPNVLMRPICQDYLLPTGFYIAGPAEISYFAQVIPLYKSFSIDQPVIYPRSSVTILERNILKIIDKFGFTASDLFSDKNQLYEKIISTLSDIDVDTEFQNCEKELTLAMDHLKEKLFSIDKTLSDATQKTNEKIMQSILVLKEKAQEGQKRKHEASLRQLNKASNVLYPNGNLQERELSFIYFAHKYGLDIVKWMFSSMMINKFEHQILEL